MMYIDVRGPYPVLFDGMKSYHLEGLTRAVTVEQAVILLKELGRIPINYTNQNAWR